MAENDPSLGLDASEFIDEVEKSDSVASKFNKTLLQTVNSLSAMGGAASDFVVRIQGMTKEGTKLSATIGQTEEGLSVLGRTLTVASNALGTNEQALSKHQQALRREMEVLGIASGSYKEFTDLLERQRRAGVLENQQKLFDSIASDSQRLAQYEQERLTRMNEQLQVTKLLQAAQDKSLQQLRQERLARAASLTANKLQSQAFALTPDNALGVLSATPGEISRVTSTIAQISRIIESGAISARRAMQIIAEAQSGTARVFEGVEARVASLGVRLQSTSNALGKSYATETERVIGDTNKLNLSFEKTRQAGEESARRILFSWRDLGRLFVIQSLHTLVGRFTLSLREGIDTAKQFEIRVSEIRTISQDAQLSFNNWATSIRTLSDQFGNPILDTAAGTYEAISNQIIHGADAASFMAKALAFSQVTVSTTADSVNLLSSVLNAYRLNVDATDRISAQLFRTIELGRVKASDIANELGRVAPLAANLGVTFEELSAAIATITIQGVTPHETLTSLFAVLNQLLKPTEEMKKFFDELGYSSGRAAIAGLGFEGVLTQIAKAAQSGNHELEQLFNEIRATRGIVAVTRAMDNYKETLNGIRNDSQAKFIEAQNIINESAGKKFEIEMNRIKNLFTTRFGQEFIQLFNDLTLTLDENGKRVKGFADTVLLLKQALTAAGYSFLTYKTLQVSLSAATVATNALLHYQELAAYGVARGYGAMSASGLIATRTLNGLRSVGTPLSDFLSLRTAGAAIQSAIVPLTAMAGAYFAVHQIQKSFAEDAIIAYDNLIAKVEEYSEAQTKDLRKSLETQTQIVSQAIDNRIKSELQYSAGVRTIYTKLADAQKKQSIETAKSIRDVFDVELSQLQSHLTQIENQSKTAAENIKEAQRNLFEQQEGLTSGRFNRALKLLPEPEQIQAMFKEIQRLQDEAANKLGAKTGDSTIAKTNLTEATKLQQQADRITNDLLDRQTDLTKKRKELLEQITKEETRISNIAEVRDARTAKKSADARRLQETKDSVQDSTEAARKKDLEDQLSSIDAQLTKLREQKNLESAISEELKRRNDVTQKFIEMNTKLQADAEKQALNEKIRLELLRTTFADLTKFKLPSILTAADKEKALTGFDAKTKVLTDAGLTDKSVLGAIADKRRQLEAQADLAIQKHTLDVNADTLDKQRQLYEKNLADLDKAVVDNAKKGTGAIGSLFQLAEVVKKFTPSQTAAGSVSTTLGLSDSGLPRMDELLKQLGDTILALKKAQESGKITPGLFPKEAQDVQDVFNKISILLAEREGGFSGAFKTGLSNLGFKSAGVKPSEVILKNDIDPANRITLETLQKQVQQQLQVFLSANKDQATQAKLREQVDKQLGALNLNLGQAKRELEAKNSATAATENLTRGLNEVGNSLQQLITSTREAANRLSQLANGTPVPAIGRALGGIIPLWSPRGTDTIPAMLSPGEFVINAYATRKYRSLLERINSVQYRAGGGEISNVVPSRSVNLEGVSLGDAYHFGDMHISVTSSGNERVDARTIAREIQNEIRLGRVKPF